MRVALERALDALEVGDVRLACEILLYLIESDGHAAERRHVCSDCGSAFEWPGLLEAHFCSARLAA